MQDRILSIIMLFLESGYYYIVQGRTGFWANITPGYKVRVCVCIHVCVLGGGGGGGGGPAIIMSLLACKEIDLVCFSLQSPSPGSVPV